jgi:hypothetical protein
MQICNYENIYIDYTKIKTIKENTKTTNVNTRIYEASENYSDVRLSANFLFYILAFLKHQTNTLLFDIL